MTRLVPRRLVALGLAAVFGLSATGVATAASGHARSHTVAAHNTADTTFLRLIYLHHLGAIQMTQDAVTRATGQTKQLAALIERQQKADLPVIRGLLKGAGLSTSVASMRDTPDQGTGDVQGMADGMTPSEMSALKGYRGTAFDAHFLTQMIVHHTGAVILGDIDLSQGESAAVKAFAHKVASSQAAQIVVMEHQLAGLTS